jgi:hypothetical protein
MEISGRAIPTGGLNRAARREESYFREGVPRFAVRAATLLLVALLLGGCTSSPPTASSSTADPTRNAPAAPPPEVSATHGAIQGLIVDEELKPVAGAVVALSSTTDPAPMARVDADATGAFVFSLLEPREYLVSASAPGHANASNVVQVGADQVRSVRLTLTIKAGLIPYVSVLIRNGLIHCEAAAVATAGNSCGAGVMPANDDRFGFPFLVGHQVTVFQATWPSRSASMLFRFDLTKTKEDGKAVPLGSFGNLIGTPILRKEFRPGDTAVEKPGTLNAADKFPSSDVRGQLNAQSWYAGNYQKEINSTVPPACAALTYCSGVGLGLEHRFTLYTSVFYRFEPSDIHSYSAIPDG